MSNLIQPNALQHYSFPNFGSDNLKLVLLTSAYTYSSSHHNLSDITGGDIVATSANLSGAANTGGVLSASNYTFTALTGSQVTQAWLYHDTGTSSTSTLLFYFNVGLGLPFTPNGTDLLVDWSTAGIAQL
jgi:hypothetical protein